eukprot:7962-Heterococcus_DN1.PRE.2
MGVAGSAIAMCASTLECMIQERAVLCVHEHQFATVVVTTLPYASASCLTIEHHVICCTLAGCLCSGHAIDEIHILLSHVQTSPKSSPSHNVGTSSTESNRKKHSLMHQLSTNVLMALAAIGCSD